MRISFSLYPKILLLTKKHTLVTYIIEQDICDVIFVWLMHRLTSRVLNQRHTEEQQISNGFKFFLPRIEYASANIKCFKCGSLDYFASTYTHISMILQTIYYSGIDIETYDEITTNMKCQISRDIYSYNSTNCLICPLNIVNCSYRSRSLADLDHSSHL